MQFLDPTIRQLLPDPSTITAMNEAASRLADAVTRTEKVAIFGITMWTARPRRRCWRGTCVNVAVIPSFIFLIAFSRGMGRNAEAVRALAAKGASLLVTVDCGTVSFEPFDEAKAREMDVVLIDHHQCGAELPLIHALVNPNRPDDLSGLGYLAAVGLVFIALVALNRELRNRNFWNAARPEPDLLSMLHLVALGTVADVAKLTGLNRAFVAKGLQALRQRHHVGLTALMDVARLNGLLEAWHLGFALGPRINAGGRIGQADLGVRLLLEDDPVEARRIAEELDRLNRERQVIERTAAKPKARRWPPSALKIRPASLSPRRKAGIRALLAWSPRA